MRALIVRLRDAHAPAIQVIEREIARGGYDRVIALGASVAKLDRAENFDSGPIVTIEGRTLSAAAALGAEPRAIAEHAARSASDGDLVVVDGARAFVETTAGVTVVSPGLATGTPGDPRVRFAIVTIDARGGQVSLEARPFDVAKLAKGRALDFRRWLEPPDTDIALPPDARGAFAALGLLAPRIGPVYFAASGAWPDDDEVDHVHDVRVATRRLRAALAIARPLLPENAADRARAKLEAFGEVLGARRAADVNLERVAELREMGSDEDVITRIEALVSARRRRTRAHLFAAYPAERVAWHGVQLLGAAMKASPRGPCVVGGMEKELVKRARVVKARLGAMGSKNDDAGHHALRIGLKRLRYTCEIIQPTMPERVSASAASDLKAMQDALGKLHDEVELIAMVDGARVRRHAPKDAVDAIVAKLKESREALLAVAMERVAAKGQSLIDALHA